MAQGLKALKVKVGIEPAADVARAKAVRAAIGPNIAWRRRQWWMESSGRDSNHPAACRRVRHLLREQPVPPLDVQWMADVRRNVPVPVMADESCYTLQDAMALARAGAADILSIYVGKGPVESAQRERSRPWPRQPV